MKREGINWETVFDILTLLACIPIHFKSVWLFVTLLTAACQTPLPRDSPGKNTGAGCHALLQGIFPDPGVEPASPAAPEFLSICLPLSCQGSPYTHHYIKKTSNNKLPFRTRNPTQYSVMASMGKKSKKRVDVCIYVSTSYLPKMLQALK